MSKHARNPKKSLKESLFLAESARKAEEMDQFFSELEEIAGIDHEMINEITLQALTVYLKSEPAASSSALALLKYQSKIALFLTRYFNYIHEQAHNGHIHELGHHQN